LFGKPARVYQNSHFWAPIYFGAFLLICRFLHFLMLDIVAAADFNHQFKAPFFPATVRTSGDNHLHQLYGTLSAAKQMASGTVSESAVKVLHIPFQSVKEKQ
jgi:hypothetical protein